MKRARLTHAFTVAEVLVASAMTGILFATLIYTALSLQHSLTATEDYSSATADQQRAIDFVSRDVRRAYTVTVSPDGAVLTLTIPDCHASYDADGNPTGAIVTPVIADGVVNYKDSTKPLTVEYFISGQRFLRRQTIGATGSISTLVLANYVADFQSTFGDANSVVNFSISFTPDFKVAHGRDTSDRGATTLTASTSVRNVRRD